MNIWMYQADDKLLVQIRCSVCAREPREIRTTTLGGGCAFALQCPGCRQVLVEYDTPEGLAKELAIHVENWRPK
jgi:hypothetical protein